ncbi:MAG: Crp/Fnr family transcriptional regulator [Bacteroidales bacterium]|nr:Crp/Fnr family transcriptional regulator [Bacteroidales bacterium]MBN2819554.1 Crp/Fnr family transcriptional regulator [Bacteroidales bacterium]
MIRNSSDSNELKEFLSTKTVFKHLSKEELDLIPLENGSEIFRRGEMIYEEGHRINGFYCVVKGIIKIFKTGFDGKDQIIRFAKPGDIMGFRSTITGELACTSTKIIEDSVICYIPGDLVKSFVKSNGEFAMDLLELACNELGEANDYITDIAQKTVRERLAEVLIHLKWSFNLDNENFLQISLTREELANIVGTATESVIRLLSEFKQDRLIELHGRKIKILDETKLIKISNMHY